VPKKSIEMNRQISPLFVLIKKITNKDKSDTIIGIILTSPLKAKIIPKIKGTVVPI